MRPKIIHEQTNSIHFMKVKHLYALIALMTGSLLVGCHSDLDLENIDTQAEVEMGVALPVGSIHATIGDFFGKGLGSFYVDSADNQGVITWKDTFKIARNFHQVDLAQYISEKQLTLNVYDKIDVPPMIGTNKVVTGIGAPVTLKFDMPLKLSGINHPDSLNKERLDSALIDMASFSSVIKTHNLPLEWDWIDSVTLYLGEQIHRPAGNVMVIYDKDRDNYGYGQTIPTVVDNFVIDLIKDGKVGQVVDSCNFEIHFTFTIPTGTTVTVPEDAGFDYKLGVQFIDYSAIWGKFLRSKDMYDEALVDLSSSWGELAWISEASVPFAEPKIDMNIVTTVAGALKIDGDYLFAEDVNGMKHFASFQYGSETKQDFHKQYYSSEYLDPITSPIGATTTNMTLHFDKDPQNGHIDELFQNMPQKLGYKFGIDFNYDMTPQIRITPNTSISIDAACTLPMIFNKGLHLSYSDTIKDVNLSKYTLESLLEDVDIIDSLTASELKIIIKAQSEIPLDIYATMRCYDKNNKEIKDPTDPSKPLLLFDQDTIQFVAPTYEYAKGGWQMVKKGETVIIAEITQDKLELLPQVDHIIYYAQIDDRSLAEAYSKGKFNIKLTEDAGLTLKVALTAKTDAYLSIDLDK